MGIIKLFWTLLIYGAILILILVKSGILQITITKIDDEDEEKDKKK